MHDSTTGSENDLAKICPHVFMMCTKGPNNMKTKLCNWCRFLILLVES